MNATLSITQIAPLDNYAGLQQNIQLTGGSTSLSFAGAADQGTIPGSAPAGTTPAASTASTGSNYAMLIFLGALAWFFLKGGL